MPIREYKCNSCDHQWEELRKGQTDAELCPNCKGTDFQRLLTSAGIQFNGAGFWKNDKKRYEPAKQVTFGPNGQMGPEKLVQPPKDFDKPPAPKQVKWE